MVDRQKVIQLETRHEVDPAFRSLGFRPTCYLDTKGKLTIGIGCNLDAPGAPELCARVGLDYQALRNGHAITRAQAQALLDDGITTAQDAATITVAGFMDMPDMVQLVIIDMLFNMGRERFLSFHRMIDAAERHDWRQMVNEMRASLWYGEVGSRAMEDIALVLSVLQPVGG